MVITCNNSTGACQDVLFPACNFDCAQLYVACSLLQVRGFYITTPNCSSGCLNAQADGSAWDSTTSGIKLTSHGMSKSSGLLSGIDHARSSKPAGMLYITLGE